MFAEKTKYKDIVLITGLSKDQKYLWRGKYECSLTKIGEFGSLVYFPGYDIYLTVDNKEIRK